MQDCIIRAKALLFQFSSVVSFKLESSLLFNTKLCLFFVIEMKHKGLFFSFLNRKDPNAFFSFPVTDFIAPGYSMIIKRPMDFSTMKEKIKNNGYQSIEELKVLLIYILTAEGGLDVDTCWY